MKRTQGGHNSDGKKLHFSFREPLTGMSHSLPVPRLKKKKETETVLLEGPISLSSVTDIFISQCSCHRLLSTPLQHLLFCMYNTMITVFLCHWFPLQLH